VKTLIVDINQSIWDLAIQHYGSPDGVMQLMLDNPTKIDFQNNITPGTEVLIDESKVLNKQIVDSIKKTGIAPASGVYDEELGYNPGDFNNDCSNDFNN
jgi:hypothetical protein